MFYLYLFMITPQQPNKTLKTLTFAPYLSEQQIQERITELAAQIDQTYQNEPLTILTVLNGAFMFAADLVRKINCPASLEFIKVQSYQGTQSSGTVRQTIGIHYPIDHKHVLILEDIVDTGLTIDYLLQMIRTDFDPLSVKTCALLFKKEAFKGQNPPDWFGFEVPNVFLLGYGLDYDGYGRNWPAIYSKV